MFELKFGKLAAAACGVLVGSYGLKILSSNTMKKAYTQVTATTLRMKDEVVKDATNLKESCGDIYADAKDINEKLAAEEEAKILADARATVAAADAAK